MRLLYFAWVKEKAGIAAEEIEPPEGVAMQRMYLRGITGDAVLVLEARKLLTIGVGQ